jgi:tetratricopeptide (TPR) repeat protein
MNARRSAVLPIGLIVLVALVAPVTATMAAAVPAGVTTQPVPRVELSGMEPAVRQQVEAAYQSAAKAATLPAPQAAAAFGEAGKTLLHYALPQAALPCFENAAALAPQEFGWEYLAGFAARLHGDLERARGHFQRALALPSPLPAALVRLGEVELLRNDLEAASRAYTAALAVPDTAAAAHFGLGRIALQHGDARLAAEHFTAVLAAQPGASIVQAQLAIAYRRLGQADKAAAAAAAHGEGPVRFADPLISELEAATGGNSNRIAAALRALQEGRRALGEAAEGFRQAAEADPRDVRAWLGLGQAQESLGDSATAEASYRRAVEIEPGNPFARLKLGTLLAQRGARGEGIAELKIAVRLRPDLKEARFNLANALAQEGRLAEAATECDALLQLAPDDRGAQALREQLREDIGRPQPEKPQPPRQPVKQTSPPPPPA